MEHICNDANPSTADICPGCLEDKKLRKLANEAWSNAATIDGLMRWLGPLIEEVQVTAWREGYNEGIRVANSDRP